MDSRQVQRKSLYIFYKHSSADFDMNRTPLTELHFIFRIMTMFCLFFYHYLSVNLNFLPFEFTLSVTESGCQNRENKNNSVEHSMLAFL